LAVKQQPTSVPEVTSEDGEPVIPPTRVSEPAAPDASAARPVAIPRQKWPIMASAGALVLLLLVIGVLFAFNRRPSTESESNGTAPADQVPSASANAGPTTSNNAPVMPAATPVAANRQPAAGDPIATSPRATPSSSARSRSGGETPATPGSSPGTLTDLSARIPVLLEQSRDDETTLSARREAANLLPQARGTQVVALRLVQVRSYAMKNEDARACEILQAVQQQSRGTEYEKEVTRLLESCPR
jgi:hypothetical protein